MPSYVVTGVSRGIGWEFLNQLSNDANNTVIGLVRNKPATDERVEKELSGRSNITILQADVTDYAALKKAAADTAAITGGKLDYIIANGALVTLWDSFGPISVLAAEKREEFDAVFHQLMETNVLGNIHLYTLFLPQILQGSGKKVVVISSGAGDMDWVNDYEMDGQALYAMSKTAMNMITAKFNAQYKKDGVLFLSICPGMVEVGHFSEITPELQGKIGALVEKFQKYAPHFKGPSTPEESVKDVLSVIHKSSIEAGNGGAFLSHFGNKQWI